MPAGFESIGDHGSYIIDGSHPNIMFLTKGSATNSVTFSSPTYPLVFIRADGGRNTRLVRGAGNTYTYYCTGAFQYWIFCSPPQNIGQNYGLQVFNASGQMIYTSIEKPLRIVGQYGYTRPGKASGVFWIANGNMTCPVLNSGALTAVNLGGANYAFAPTFSGNAGGHTAYSGSYPREDAYYTQWGTVEGLRATATGFEVREYLGPGRGMEFQSSLMFPYYLPGWIDPPGHIVVADISGL